MLDLAANANQTTGLPPNGSNGFPNGLNMNIKDNSSPSSESPVPSAKLPSGGGGGIPFQPHSLGNMPIEKPISVSSTIYMYCIVYQKEINLVMFFLILNYIFCHLLDSFTSQLNHLGEIILNSMTHIVKKQGTKENYICTVTVL